MVEGDIGSTQRVSVGKESERKKLTGSRGRESRKRMGKTGKTGKTGKIGRLEGGIMGRVSMRLRS